MSLGPLRFTPATRGFVVLVAVLGLAAVGAWSRRRGRRASIVAEGRLQLPGPADPVGQVLQVPRPRRARTARPGCGSTRRKGPSARPNRAPAPSCRATSRRASSISRITAEDESERMPPKSLGRTLSPEEIDILKRWIEQGAEWQAHWSFLPPVAAPVPDVKHAAWPRNPIDRFVLARLEAERPHPGPRGRQGAADPPRHVRPHRACPRPSPRSTPSWPIATPDAYDRAGRPPAGLAAVRRAHGRRLARPGPLRRHLRLPGRRLSRHVALARLGRPGVQRRTCPTTGSSPGNWPATCCPSRPATRSSPRPSTGTIARPTRGAASRKSSASSTSPTGPTPSRPRSSA